MPEMDAPKALVFRPLVKLNEALGERLLWELQLLFQACAIEADCVVIPDGQNSVISFVISK